MKNEAEIIKNSYSITDAAISIFGYCNNKSMYKTKKIMEENGISLSYFKGRNKNTKWELIKKSCPVCNKKFETLKSHPREKQTCSRKCANIYFSKNKKGSFKEKKILYCKYCKKPVSVDKRATSVLCDYCKNNRKYIKKESGGLSISKCSECNKKIKKYNKTGLCKDCFHKDKEYKHKLSKIAKDNVKNGKHKGWKTRKKLEPSYPEQYFINLLNKENINFEWEKPIGKYFADFSLPNKILLEVDGKQHNLPERKISDIKKDNFLKENGYKVYRIKWYNPINESKKRKLYSQIDNFISSYYESFI